VAMHAHARREWSSQSARQKSSFLALASRDVSRARGYKTFVHDPTLLDHDILRLSSALWSAVKSLGGQGALDRCRKLGASSIELRHGDFAGGRRAFAEQISQLSEDDLEECARAYALWCHLMNIAEERHRLRVLRERGTEAPDGLAAGIDALIDAGASE